MKIFCRFFILLLAGNSMYSCTNKNDNSDSVMKTLTAELQKSSEIIRISNFSIYNKLRDDALDPVTKTKGEIWNRKALQVQKLSNGMISNLKKSLLDENTNWTTINDEYQKTISGYKSIDSAFGIEFSHEFDNTIRFIDSIKSNSKFLNNNQDARIAVIKKEICEIYRLENTIISFCSSQSCRMTTFFDIDEVLIGQNTTHLRTGDELIISAGVGAYNSKANAKVTIGGKNLEVINATATSKTIIQEAPGKHFKRVRVEYMGHDSLPKFHTVDVQYIVDKH